jgi:hypothetical protein
MKFTSVISAFVLVLVAQTVTANPVERSDPNTVELKPVSLRGGDPTEEIYITARIEHFRRHHIRPDNGTRERDLQDGLIKVNIRHDDNKIRALAVVQSARIERD